MPFDKSMRFLLENLVHEVIEERRRRRRKKRTRSQRRRRRMYWPIGGVYTLGLPAFDSAESCSAGSIGESDEHLLRSIIREMISHSDYRIIENELWGRLSDHQDLVENNLRVFFEPSSDQIEQFKANLEDSRSKLAELENTITKPSVHITTLKDQYKVWSLLLSHIGHFGKLKTYAKNQYFSIVFDDGVEPDINVSIEWLWVILDRTPPDWRPNETLPEDYYSL